METKQTVIQKLLASQFIRYIMIGGINTIISLVVFNVLLFIVHDNSDMMKAIMMIPSQFTGILVSYILNSTLNFKRKLSIQGFIAFGGPLAILQLVVGSGGMYQLSVLGMEKNVAYVLITGLNIVLGYTITKFLLSKFTEEAE